MSLTFYTLNILTILIYGKTWALRLCRGWLKKQFPREFDGKQKSMQKLYTQHVYKIAIKHIFIHLTVRFLLTALKPFRNGFIQESKRLCTCQISIISGLTWNQHVINLWENRIINQVDMKLLSKTFISKSTNKPFPCLFQRRGEGEGFLVNRCM